MSDNGNVPAEGPGLAAHIEQAQRTRAHVIAELRELHEAESAILDELTRQQHEARARRDSYKRALDNLGAPTARVADVTRDGKQKGRPTGRSTARVYRPGDEYLEQVLTALRASSEPLAHKHLIESEHVTMSQETLSRATRVLRDEGRIRVAHQVRNQPFYALMPDA